ncbi:MAG: PKD repeat protein [Cellvibrionaceae bacterium]|jgi:PKD repeat protein
MSSSAQQGKVLYDSLNQGCLSCHGADGQAAAFKPIDIAAGNYEHSSLSGGSYSLEEYIELWMPVRDPSICIGSCATNIAAFIRTLSDQTEPDPQLVADASASQNFQGFAPLVVTFNASQSFGSIVSFQWDFDNGDAGSGSQLDYQYDAPGTYQAQLTVTDGNGNVDTSSLAVIVQANGAPTAVISSSSVTGIAPLTVDFDAASSSDDQEIVSYEWTILSTSLNGTNNSYTFDSPGTYEVLLRVIDSSGLDATDTQTITVASPEINIAPVANASRSSSLSGPAPLIVDFDASASSDDRNEITNYYWTFDNGQEMEGVSAMRTFDTEGQHIVYLTVFDSGNLSNTVELRVNVSNANQAPQATITALNSTIGLAPYSLSFSSASSSDDSGIAQWAWDINGDNTADSAVANPTFSFAQVGDYNVSLTVSDEQGISDSDNISVQILDPGAFAADRYAVNCSSCHGADGEGVASNPPLTKVWAELELAQDVARMIDVNGDCQGVEESACVNAVASYILDQFPSTPTEPPVVTGNHLISVPVKALTEDEFYNTVEAVFSVTFSNTEKANFNLPLDSSGSRYSTDSELRVLRGISEDSGVLDDLYPALTTINNSVVASLTDSDIQNTYGAAAGCSFSNIANDEGCRTAYRSAVLSKAFRRTVSGNDYALNSASDAYDIFIFNGLDARDAFVSSIVSYTLFSPAFLFHSYRGDEAVGEGYQLTNEELAHKIAYLVWGAPADSTLLSRDWNSLLAGENGSSSDDELSAELQRLFADAKSKYFIDTFLDQWLELETDVAQQLSFTSDSSRAGEFAEAIKGESEHFIRYLITQNQSINSIINANYTFMNSSLADFYGVDVSGLGSDFTQVDLSASANSDLSNRQGLLTQANFLTTGSKSDRPGSIHRGVTILRDVMCHTIGPPQGEAPDTSGVDRTLQTEPALFRDATEDTDFACAGCHETINPVSFPFESFDRFGRHPLALSQGGSLFEYAVYEAIGIDGIDAANGPVEKAEAFLLDDRGGNINIANSYGSTISGSFSDHQGLISLIGQSPAFGECVTDNFYDFIIGTNAERGLSASSIYNESQHASQVASKQAALEGVSGIRTLILNLLKRPEFRVIRRDE